MAGLVSPGGQEDENKKREIGNTHGFFGRYNAGRGAHLTLKRAEKARALVNKLQAMVEALASKTMAWEKERGVEFTYDGIRLLSMLEEYTLLRQEKEQERRRQRDQKKLQGQLIAEQEALYGSKPSPSKTHSVKKAPRMSTGGASSRRLSVGGAVHHTPKHDPLHSTKATPHSRPIRKSDRVHPNELMYPQDDGISVLSAGRRGLDVAGLPVKKHSFGSNASVREVESPMVRIPFSPISSTTSSKANNTTNLSDDMNLTHGETTLHKTLSTNNMQFTTPTKPATTSMADDENKTPKAMPIPVPATPLTVSIPMQTAMTPAPPPVSFGTKVVEDLPEEIEYSFEEIRAGFVLSKTHVKSMMIQG